MRQCQVDRAGNEQGDVGETLRQQVGQRPERAAEQRGQRELEPQRQRMDGTLFEQVGECGCRDFDAAEVDAIVAREHGGIVVAHAVLLGCAGPGKPDEHGLAGQGRCTRRVERVGVGERGDRSRGAVEVEVARIIAGIDADQLAQRFGFGLDRQGPRAARRVDEPGCPPSSVRSRSMAPTSLSSSDGGTRRRSRRRCAEAGCRVHRACRPATRPPACWAGRRQSR